jgi:hypothetical protein
MNSLLPVILVLAVLVTTGCIHGTGSPAVTPIVRITETPTLQVTSVLTATPVPAVTTSADRAFLDAVDRCYKNTPVIRDVKTNLDFTLCMQHTPLPAGACEQQLRREILQYTTKDDDTTAGYDRETYNMQVARVRYSGCTGRALAQR